MLQAIRSLQPANWPQVQAEVIKGVDQAQKAIDQMEQYLKQDENKKRIDFLRDVRTIKSEMVKLRRCVSGFFSFIIPPVYEHIVDQSEHLKKIIRNIYSSVQHKRNRDNGLETNLLLRFTKELEVILDDQSAPQYHALKKSLSHPSPEQIESLSNKQLLLDTLVEFKNTFQGHSATCFVSYEWKSQPFVLLLVHHLKLAGIQMVLDIEYGPDMCRNLPNMEHEIQNVDYVMVMGSVVYGEKSCAPTGSGVRDEVPLIQERFSKERDDVLLILLEEIPTVSFPPGLDTNQFVYADMRQPDSYPSQIILILEGLYRHITAEHPELKRFVVEKRRLFPSAAPSLAPSRNIVPVQRPNISQNRCSLKTLVAFITVISLAVFVALSIPISPGLQLVHGNSSSNTLKEDVINSSALPYLKPRNRIVKHIVLDFPTCDYPEPANSRANPASAYGESSSDYTSPPLPPEENITSNTQQPIQQQPVDESNVNTYSTTAPSSDYPIGWVTIALFGAVMAYRYRSSQGIKTHNELAAKTQSNTTPKKTSSSSDQSKETEGDSCNQLHLYPESQGRVERPSYNITEESVWVFEVRILKDLAEAFASHGDYPRAFEYLVQALVILKEHHL